MSAQLHQARKNRILALRTVAARNIDPVAADRDGPLTFKASHHAPLVVVADQTNSPWQAEGVLAA